VEEVVVDTIPHINSKLAKDQRPFFIESNKNFFALIKADEKGMCDLKTPYFHFSQYVRHLDT